MEPRELIYNVYKDIVSIKNSFDNENLWCNPYKTIQGLTPMTPGYVISMEYAPHIDIEEYFSEEFIEKLKLCFKKYQKDAIIWMVNHSSISQVMVYVYPLPNYLKQSTIIMATTATQIINIVTFNKSTLHWMVSRIVQDSINFYYFWDEYYINAYGITEEKANEQLEMYLSFNIYKNLYQDLRVKIDQSPIVFFEYLQEIATHIVRDIAFWETVTQICGATKIIINEKA